MSLQKKQLLQDLQENGWRQLIWLEGDYVWCQQEVAHICQLLLSEELQKEQFNPASLAGIWLQGQAQIEFTPRLELLPQGVRVLSGQQVKPLLGSQQQVLIVDTFSGLHPDALGAVAGTLSAGAILLFITPANWPAGPCPDYRRLAAWPYATSSLSYNFLQRWAKILQTKKVPKIQQNTEKKKEAIAAISGNWKLPKTVQNTKKPIQKKLPYGAISAEQAQVIEQLLGWFKQTPNSQNPAPLVLTAPRGRGKSSALGLMARQLLELADKNLKILVTAPAAFSTQALFARLQEVAPAAAHLEKNLAAKIKFIAPDALLADLPEADLLLVDEAAALPVPVLQKILAAYPVSIFATTQQGYEGSGRGFGLRFMQHLQTHAPEFLHLKLEQPLRWNLGCPLEKLLAELLLLDGNFALNKPLENLSEPIPAYELQWLNQQDLAQQEDLLRQAFGLLSLAHYRTQPDNLRLLLDAPGVRLTGICTQQEPKQLLGLAWLQQEGGFPQDLAQEIYLGTRRPQGNLLAQSLAFHGGLAQAAELKFWRVQRIVIAPQLQGKGLGSKLLEFISQAALQETSLDMLGTSFGATQHLARFWYKAGFQPLRLGHTQDQASGEFTLQLGKPLSAAGKAVQAELQTRLAAILATGLRQEWQQLCPHLALELLIKCLNTAEFKKTCAPELSPASQRELHAFAYGHRPLSLSFTALKEFFWHYLQRLNLQQLDLQLLDIQQLAQVPTQLSATVLTAKPQINLTAWLEFLLQEHSTPEVAARLKFNGNKQFTAWLRQQLQQIL